MLASNLIYFPHIPFPQRLSERERISRVEMNIHISKLEILFPRIKLTLLDFCLYYFSIAVLKHHKQGSLEKKEFTWFYVPEGRGHHGSG